MECLHMDRIQAAWYTPMVTMLRMQRAYLENQGEPQKWAKTRLDKIMELNHAE
jgi:hypothetical protein